MSAYHVANIFTARCYWKKLNIFIAQVINNKRLKMHCRQLAKNQSIVFKGPLQIWTSDPNTEFIYPSVFLNQ
jgi:hypothetical protein